MKNIAKLALAVLVALIISPAFADGFDPTFSGSFRVLMCQAKSVMACEGNQCFELTEPTGNDAVSYLYLADRMIGDGHSEGFDSDLKNKRSIKITSVSAPALNAILNVKFQYADPKGNPLYGTIVFAPRQGSYTVAFGVTRDFSNGKIKVGDITIDKTITGGPCQIFNR